MKTALIDGQPVEAGPGAPEVATCPDCSQTVDLRQRLGVYYYRHPKNARPCPAKARGFRDLPPEPAPPPPMAATWPGLTLPFGDDDPLGPCCACLAAEAIHFLALPHLAPIAGHGWGCFICHLPAAGALAVVCSACLPGVPQNLKMACRGRPATEGRTRLDGLTGEFRCNEAVHTSWENACRKFINGKNEV